jgi:hypothetical protein
MCGRSRGTSPHNSVRSPAPQSDASAIGRVDAPTKHYKTLRAEAGGETRRSGPQRLGGGMLPRRSDALVFSDHLGTKKEQRCRKLETGERHDGGSQ